MPVTYIQGSFRIVGASPDGDSIRFYPTNPTAFTDAHIEVRANSSGGVQLRLDAIDALETHYTPRSAPRAWRQPAQLGDHAGDTLLSILGFADVVRDEHLIVTSANPSEQPGYILTGFADKYGRAVSMAYAGQRPGQDADGSSVFLDVNELRQSLNYQLVDLGLTYPTFYSRLYHDLRDELANAAIAARNGNRGVWASDATLPGFTLGTRDELEHTLVILPKLFRRLADYLTLDETGGADLAGFSAFLEQKADRLFTVPAGQATHLDTLVDVNGQTVRLTLPPEQIVFLEG